MLFYLLYQGFTEAESFPVLTALLPDLPKAQIFCSMSKHHHFFVYFLQTVLNQSPVTCILLLEKDS